MGESSHQKQGQSKKRRVHQMAEIRNIFPVLSSSDYFVQPLLDEMAARELRDSGYCSRVPNFVVGRTGYGQINFFGETDIRGLDLERVVKFSRNSVVVYENENEKPSVGYGLNKAAEVTLVLQLRRVVPHGLELDKLVGNLKRFTERQGAFFVSFNSLNSEWKFLVHHFSRFGLNEDEEEDVFMDDAIGEEDENIKNTHSESSGDFLSHSLPANLGLDPVKMQEMRMIMFSTDEEDEDFDMAFAQEKRFFTDEHVKIGSPVSNSKMSISRSPMRNPARKNMAKVSPQKSPQPLLTYHSNGSDLSPSQSILMTRQNKDLTLRSVKVEGFKLVSKHSTPLTASHTNYIVDAGLFMGKSFRVGWGPNGILVHAGSPVASPGTGLSSVINVERIAIDKVAKDEKNKLKEELIDLCFVSPLNAHKSLNREFVKIEVESLHVKLYKVLINRYLPADICRGFIEIIEKQLDVEGLSTSSRLFIMHQVTIWELMRVLFFERKNDAHLRPTPDADNTYYVDEEDIMLDKKDGTLDIDSEAQSYIRRADFSLWLQDSVCHRVQEELSSLKETCDLEHILLLLSGRQLDAAVELAASRGDVRLGILLSQSGTSMVSRNDMARQLDIWKNNGLNFKFVEKNRLKIFELLAGNIQGAFADSVIDWKRYLGLVMWYQLPPDTPLPIIIHTYQQLLSEGVVPHPVPVYVDEGPPDEAVNWSEGDRYDLAYYLLLLHANHDNSFDYLKTMFSAFSSTHDPFDYHMIWHQRAILEAIGAFSSDDLHVLDISYISQLLCLGQCHWAIYVALHIPYREDFPHLHEKLIKEILLQYCECWSSQEMQRQFIEDLGMPSEWLHEALAIYSYYYGDMANALEHFLKCFNWQKAHSIFMTSVAHILFLASKHSEIWRLACSMEDHKIEIANWDLGAGIFVTFYELKSSLQEEKVIREADALETMTVACKSFFCRLNESLLAWGNKLPLEARVTYSGMVEQLSKLLVSIPEGSATAQMNCFDAILSAPIPEDFRSSHLQDAVSVFTYFISAS